MRSSLSYATFANYSPRGQSELSRRSRNVCARIKAADANLIDAMIRTFQEPAAAPILYFFDDDVALVPAPGSAPLIEGAVWTPRVICQRLVNSGFGTDVLPCLKRTKAVPKSAFAAPGERPTVARHYETFAVDRGLIAPARITLVDDVLTKGRTAIAAASRLEEAFPQAEIRLLAVIRTQGLVPEIVAIKDPSTGMIRYDAITNDAERQQ